MPRAADPEGRGVETAGLPALVVLLVLLAAGPLVSPQLPEGPGSLLTPQAASVAAAEVALLWALVLWPLLCRRRSAASVAATGALALLVAVPFVAGPSLVWGGTGWGVLRATAVLAAALLVTGLYLAGPGRARERDRAFVAVVALVAAAVPLANYGLNEFGGVEGDTGYALSPVLAVRAALLALPGADPRPCLLLLLVAAAVLIGLRLRGSGAAALLLVLSGTADAAEVEPVFGGAYVPGRPTPLRARVAGEADTVWVEVPGIGTYGAPAAAEGTVVAVPAPRDFGRVKVRRGDAGEWEWVDLSLAAVPPGDLLLVSLSPFPPEAFDRARQRGIVLGRARLPRLLPDVLLHADGVLDPNGVLSEEDSRRLVADGVPVLRDASNVELDRMKRGRPLLRRIWEEEDTLLSPDPLWRVFPPEGPYDPGRARGAFLVLLCFGIVSLVALRYVRHRMRGVVAVLLLLLLTAPALTLVVTLVPPVPAVRETGVTVHDAGRRVRIRRYEAVRDGVAASPWRGPPVPLDGAAGLVALRDETGVWRSTLPLKAHEVRLCLAESGGAEWPWEDALTLHLEKGEVRGPEGDAVGLDEYLRSRSGPDARRAWILRKLVRLGPVREGMIVDVSFDGPDVVGLFWSRP